MCYLFINRHWRIQKAQISIFHVFSQKPFQLSPPPPTNTTTIVFSTIYILHNIYPCYSKHIIPWKCKQLILKGAAVDSADAGPDLPLPLRDAGDWRTQVNSAQEYASVLNVQDGLTILYCKLLYIKMCQDFFDIQYWVVVKRVNFCSLSLWFSVPILQDNGIKMASFLSNPEIVPLYNILPLNNIIPCFFIQAFQQRIQHWLQADRHVEPVVHQRERHGGPRRHEPRRHRRPGKDHAHGSVAPREVVILFFAIMIILLSIQEFSAHFT